MATKQKNQVKTGPQTKGQPQGGAVAAASPSKIQSLTKYFEDSRTELAKVSWPTAKETKVTAFAVLVLVVVMCIFLGLADLLLSSIMEAILSMGR
ncbi:preprotein translocase subunit SecE [Desulfovibrio sp. OttesenSCG-928-G15]|nr:preprotein translocase subunit SecE [Desulfovibrio sp. OttesenSCG-928-G15]